MKRVVIKVGSHVLSDEDKLNEIRIQNLCDFIAKLLTKYEVILVSSGAIVSGIARSHIKKDSIVHKQMLAAIGQPFLMEIYNKFFSKYNIQIAQILLSAQDFDSRKRTLHAKNAIDALCLNGFLPIINENDATAIEEIVFGDNDQLSASVTQYFDGDLLVILSDIDGYYDFDPRVNKSAKVRKTVSKLTKEELKQDAKPGSNVGTGGISTKLKAASFLFNCNKPMFLANGFNLEVVSKFLLEDIQMGGTYFSKEDD